MKIHCVLALVLTILPLQASSKGGEILAALQARINHGGDLSEVYDLVEDLPGTEVKALYRQVDRAWPNLKNKYIAHFQRSAKNSSGKAKEHKKRIRDLRKELAGLQSLADGPMKIALKKTGMPALDELRTLLIPTTQSVLAGADDSLKKERRTILALAGLRDTLIKVAIIPIDESSDAQIHSMENATLRTLSGLDRKGLRIMEKNRKIAQKAKIPEPERLGVADANTMRLLAGLNALVIDPKLCATGRDHSKDMETLGFFAHESPVKGKKTPFIRANNFGTTASAENIYMGSTHPREANKAWFYSPGHHRNMFNPSHRRIGLGQHNRHWTQLFGR